MSALQESVVVHPWDDPKYQDAIRKKGERVKGTAKDEVVIEASKGPKELKEPMRCDNCGLPYLIVLAKHCVCPPWTIGLAK